MRLRFVTALLGSVVVSGAMLAAQRPAPQTIADCLKASREYVSQKYRAARASGQKADIPTWNQEKLELAKACAARFPLEQVNGADLPLLAQLLVEAGDKAAARAAIARRLAMPGITTTEKAQALLAGVDVAFASPITDAGVEEAEGYVGQLDALGQGAFDQRLEAHSRLGGYFRGIDIDEKIVTHMSAVLAMAESLSAEKRKALGFRLVNAYTSLAEVHGGRGDAARAVALLEKGLVDLASVPEAAKYIPEVVKRYKQVGTRGTAIDAPHWLNAEPGTTTLDPAGRVTIIQFTARWCGPCRKSYPAMLRLHEKYAARGLQVLFSTQLYGFFEQRRPLSAEEELAADREYFVNHHRIPFKISIEPQRVPVPDAPAPAAGGRTWTEERYFVSGIPQIVILDKQGIIRRVMVGWDPANEARVNQLIEELLE